MARWRAILALLVLVLLVALYSCANDISVRQGQGGSAQNLIELTLRLDGAIDTETWYYFAFKFDDDPTLAEAEQPKAEITGSEAAKNWDAYVYFRTDDLTNLSSNNLKFRKRSPGEPTTGEDAWFKKPPLLGAQSPFLLEGQEAQLAVGNFYITIYIRTAGLTAPGSDRILEGFWVQMFTANAPIDQADDPDRDPPAVVHHSLTRAVFVRNLKGVTVTNQSAGGVIADAPQALKKAAKLVDWRARTFDRTALPNVLRINWRVRDGRFDPTHYYFMVINFTNVPINDREDLRPFPDISSEDSRGKNWDLYILYTEASGSPQFLFLRRGPNDALTGPQRWTNSPPQNISGLGSMLKSFEATNGEIRFVFDPRKITNVFGQRPPWIMIDFITADAGIDDLSNPPPRLGRVFDWLERPLVIDLFQDQLRIDEALELLEQTDPQGTPPAADDISDWEVEQLFE